MEKYISKQYLKEKFMPLKNDMEILLNSETDCISEYDYRRTKDTIINMCKAIINEME